jgi:DNA polymerase-3 subunit chi
MDSYEKFDRCLEIFDGNDDKAVISARTRWLTYKDAGYAPSYWQEDEAGGWGKRKIR